MCRECFKSQETEWATLKVFRGKVRSSRMVSGLSGQQRWGEPISKDSAEEVASDAAEEALDSVALAAWEESI